MVLSLLCHQDGSELPILFPVSPRCWDYTLLPSCLAKSASRTYPLHEALSLSQYDVVMGAGVGVKQENRPYMDCVHWGQAIFSVTLFLSHVTQLLKHFAFFVLYVCVCRACLCVSMCAGMPIRCLLHILTTLQSKSLCEPNRLQFVFSDSLLPAIPVRASQALVLETSCPANTNTIEHSACASDPNLGSTNLPETALPTESSLQPQVGNPIFMY